MQYTQDMYTLHLMQYITIQHKQITALLMVLPVSQQTINGDFSFTLQCSD